MSSPNRIELQPKRFLVLLFSAGVLFVLVGALVDPVVGQQPAGLPLRKAQGNQAAPGGQANLFGGVGNNGLLGSEGGSANADFDSLIDLIQSTVASDTWMENGTGDGEISPFPTGVFVDSVGTLRFSRTSLAKVPLSRPPTESAGGEPKDVRRGSPLRFVSLPRLEAAILRRQIAHQPLAPEMLTLAGLERIEYVLVDPDAGELVLAGPAGDWQAVNGLLVSVTTGRPVVRLDDLLTLWRRRQSQAAVSFGCSINPRQEALARTQQYLQASGSEPIEPNERGQWLKGLRDTLGKQDVEFFGIDGANHVARVLLVADYHMKLIGMGIADGVPGVESYLSTVRLLPDGSAPPMSVLRWWFAMNYEPVEVSADRCAFRLQGQGVQVLSENELLAARGQRVHTGKSDDLNRRFAASFTEHFEEIAAAYPLYGELRNVFDLSLVLAMIEREGLRERVGWQAELFTSADALRLPQVAVPREVETVVNHRVINRRQIIAGVSGGVWADARKSLDIRAADVRETAAPVQRQSPADPETWWWD
jgi:Protein of unknown function (DUF1598)